MFARTRVRCYGHGRPPVRTLGAARKEPCHDRSSAHRPPAADPRVHRCLHARHGATRRRSARSARPSGSAPPPPCTRTSPRCSASASCAGTRRSPVPSRSAATRRRAPRSSAGPSATCPLVGEVAAGTDVLAQENVEEVVPVPADLTGDGDLFMLKVRGDSMIDAGILDGDFVVVRSQPEAAQRRDRRRRHPRRGGHGQDLQPQRRPGRARAVQPAARADGVRRRRGPGLRHGSSP